MLQSSEARSFGFDFRDGPLTELSAWTLVASVRLVSVPRELVYTLPKGGDTGSSAAPLGRRLSVNASTQGTENPFRQGSGFMRPVPCRLSGRMSSESALCAFRLIDRRGSPRLFPATPQAWLYVRLEVSSGNLPTSLCNHVESCAP